MLTLDQLRNPSEDDLARFDVAEVDLACAMGLPGSERLDIPACLAWIDCAAGWVRRHTAGRKSKGVRTIFLGKAKGSELFS